MKSTLATLFICNILCAQTHEFLDKNKVKAGINVSNFKFFEKNTEQPDYEVPAGGQRHAMFAGSIWIAGLDQSNQLHIAANKYDVGITDFFPGPLDTGIVSAFVASNTAVYNRLWKIDCDDIH